MCKKYPFIEIYDKKMLSLLAPGLLALHGPDYSCAGILCTSHEDAMPPFSDMLVLHFQDTCEMDERSFNHELAKEAHDYIEAHKDASTLYICCDSGESRSTGMACALMRIWGEDESLIRSNPFFHPNMLVYRLMIEAYGIELSEAELEQMEAQSRLAFAKATAGGKFPVNRNWGRIATNSHCQKYLKRQFWDWAFYCAKPVANPTIETSIDMAARWDRNAKVLEKIFEQSDEFKVWRKLM